MLGRVVILACCALVLSACEKDFDEKYQDNLEQLDREAKEIEARVERQLAEGREADKAMQRSDDAATAEEPAREAAE
ncbi:hypothetical protein [Parasphingorhabdus sp.]|uniref:hypothetical protein n=1 Tax=Parasphingorhabdus sp. TaxID=2709688 RepID=UPI003001CC39